MPRLVPIGNLVQIGNRNKLTSRNDSAVSSTNQFYRIQSFTGYSAQALPLRKRASNSQPPSLGLPWKQERNAAASRPRGQDQPKEKSRPIATVHQRRHQLADLEFAQLPPSTNATNWPTSTTTDPITFYEYWNRKGQRYNQPLPIGPPFSTKQDCRVSSTND